MNKIKLFLFASLMIATSIEKGIFAQGSTNFKQTMLVTSLGRATFAKYANNCAPNGTLTCTPACTPLNETFGSTSSCIGFAQGASSPYVYNQTLVAYSPGGAADTPGDGEYSIRCDGDENNAGWFGGGGTTMADHTADAAGQSGFYLLVNSGAGPREFYHRTVNNLCPSATYNLSYYAGNITRNNGSGGCNYGLLPSLSAYTFPAGTAPNNSCLGSKSCTGAVPAGGTLLGATGNISCPSTTTFTWNQYSYNFTTGAAETSIDIVLESLAGNNAGGDFAVDDIVVTYVSGAGSCTLPVGLMSFTAEKAPQNVLLKWSTATEENFSHFVVERSTDAVNFQQIGIVNGSGGSKREVDYTYADNSANQGIFYYRLKEVDIDGKFKYSPVSNVNVDITSPVFIYSSDGDLTIQFTAKGEATYAVIDMMGKTISSGNRISDESLIIVNKSNFKNGIYIVKVQMGTEMVTRKIVLN